MSVSLAKFFADETGVTAIEYGLVSSFISLILMGAASRVGLDVRSVFRMVAWGLDTQPAQLMH